MRKISNALTRKGSMNSAVSNRRMTFFSLAGALEREKESERQRGLQQRHGPKLCQLKAQRGDAFGADALLCQGSSGSSNASGVLISADGPRFRATTVICDDASVELLMLTRSDFDEVMGYSNSHSHSHLHSAAAAGYVGATVTAALSSILSSVAAGSVGLSLSTSSAP